MSIFSQDPLREQLWNGMGGPEDEGEPLIEGGNPAWNPFLQHVPEDKRQEVVPILQEWDKSYSKLNEEYAPWKEFASSGLDPETVNTAVGVFNLIESQPNLVYESLGNFLGVTPKEAKEMVEETTESTGEGTGFDIEKDPRFQTMKQQVDTLSQVALARHKQEQEAQATAQQEQELERELSSLKKQYGDFPENEVIMRMAHMDMSAEEAFKDYQKFVDEVRQRRPAPFVLGGGSGTIPKPNVDVKSLDDKGRKNLVAEMLRHSRQER